MRRTLFHLAVAVRSWLALLSVLLIAPLAHAQEAGPETPADKQPVIVPPKLTGFVQAEYPGEAKAQGLTATVELELTISSKGEVTEAKAVTPQGNGFDEAAVAAAEKFRFEPATKDGVAMASKIRYAYVFELKPVMALPLPEKAWTVTLRGVVQANVDKQKLPGAEVLLTPKAGGDVARQTADANGAFAFTGLKPSTYHIIVQASGFKRREFDQELLGNPHSDAIYDAVFALQVSTEPENFGAVARVDPPPREVTRRSIPSEQLTRIAGTRGDALRTVQILPGVGRAPFFSGALIVRGSSPQDSQIFFEGVPVPLAYHFGGIVSVFNSRLLDSIDFYPGNFGTRYGRKIGGIVEINAKDVSKGNKRWDAIADINLIDGSVLIETPIADKGGVALAARRSWIDAVFQAVVPQDSLQTLAAPVFYDYQAFGWYNLTKKDKLNFAFYGSSDKLRLYLKEIPDNNPLIRGNLDFSTAFYGFQTSWKRQLAPGIDQTLELGISRNNLNAAIGEQNFKLDFTQVQARAEWKARIDPALQIIGGMDIQWIPFDLSLRLPPPTQNEGDPAASRGASNASELVDRKVSAAVYRPALYFEAGIRPVPQWTVIPGIRLDFYKEIQSWSVDPRISTRYQLTDRLTLKGGIGLFSQPPEFQNSDPELGNPNLKPSQAIHTSVGADYKLFEGVTVGTDLFYKYLYNLVVNTPNYEAPYFINNGTGNIYGLEVLGKIQPKRPYFGYLSYTLMRSTRRDNGGPTRLFDFDQTHILTVAAVYRLGRGWETGATFRLISGNPYTPVTGGLYNANSDIYQPMYGAVNSIRNPLFNRLDIRVEKMWTFQSWRLALYLDVQNIYNATNREGVQYSFNYTQTSNIRGLPFLPVLGLRAEL